jgi:hypothetical protein
MTYLPHWKVALIGELGFTTTVSETWTCALRFDGVDSQVNDQTAYDAAASTCYAALSAWITSGLNDFSQATHATECRVYKIGADGLSTGLIGYSTGDRVTGGSGSSLHPYQISNVISLVAEGRAPGVRGRIYPPPQGISVDINSHIDGGDADNMLTEFQTLKDGLSHGLSALTAATPQLVVASGVGAGSLKQVTEVRVGRVPDTHRSRRRSLDELYHSVALTPS